MAKILCVDDDNDLCALLKRFLGKNGHEVELAYSGNSGLGLFNEKEFDLVLCDFRLPDKDGLDMIRALKNIRPYVPLILMTAYADVNVAVKSIKMGAFDYVSKPILPDEILLTLEKALEHAAKLLRMHHEMRINGEYTATQKQAIGGELDYIIGESKAGKQIQELIELVAPTDMTVILLGESGTGKEIAARAIHHYSKRNKKPFLAVDCGALSPDLAASELFGHKKGAFTGALFDKRGYFQLASGGTLFLDEIGNLSQENQIKLLRVLQEKKVRMIGDERDTEVDVRLIVATNDNLKRKMSEGSFRQDIFFRLDEFSISLPSLRDRREDIPVFTEHFLDLANQQLDKNIPGVEEEVLEKFLNYSWPGNLRELKNIVKRCALFTTRGKISVKVLPDEIVHPDTWFMDTASKEEDHEILDLKSAVGKAEKSAILNALVRTNYNKSKTADLLQVDRKTLYNKMNNLGIENS
ncbi:MAG TPA: sigma-54-dependent Fis family transcriptional regulator [Bacteroidetes bacterium]|nr:sigma-54-dependent Fis family transcriptional regulator [Bacteroidota bacterium]